MSRHSSVPMAPGRFNTALKILGWSARYVARQCGLSPAAVNHWQHGRVVIPQPVAIWIQRRLAAHFKDPAPVLEGRPVGRPAQEKGGAS